MTVILCHSLIVLQLKNGYAQNVQKLLYKKEKSSGVFTYHDLISIISYLQVLIKKSLIKIILIIFLLIKKTLVNNFLSKIFTRYKTLRMCEKLGYNPWCESSRFVLWNLILK